MKKLSPYWIQSYKGVRKMEEENEKAKGEGEKTTDAADNSGEGIQSETISELDRADQINERQARENTRREKILDREEAMKAREIVGGSASAGKSNPVKKVLSDVEYAEALEKGEVDPFKEDGY